jgi:uncharacterized protein (TIGR02145 family)
MKLHVAGTLVYSNGDTINRAGNNGLYWTSQKASSTRGNDITIPLNYAPFISIPLKSIGIPLRCVKGNTPVVTTAAATALSAVSVTLGGNVTDDGGETVTGRGICCSELDNPDLSSPGSITGGNGTGVFSMTLSGLLPNTLYHVRAYATNLTGTAYGNQVNFTTPSTFASVLTGKAFFVKDVTATIGGTVPENGGVPITQRGIQYSTSADFTPASFSYVSADTGKFIVNLTALIPETKYYARAYALNSVGPSYGTTISFITVAGPCSFGYSLVKSHVAGDVAPVTKTVLYETIQSVISGSSKCWITQNLGADNAAFTSTDATEESAGWYWQFNRKQGYSHNGSAKTPNYDWTIYNNDNSNWNAANDPCTIMLGAGWRIPTTSEWQAVVTNNKWKTAGDAFNSNIHLHLSGIIARISDGNGLYHDELKYRGNQGFYWTSTQNVSSPDLGSVLAMDPNNLQVTSANSGLFKFDAAPLRCLKD